MQVLGLSLKISAIALLETNSCIRNPTTLRLLCCEKNQANHEKEPKGGEPRNPAVLFRVLWRNRTNGIYRTRKKEIYCKGLAYIIVGAEKSYDLSSRSWKPRTAGGLVPVQT